MVLRSQILLNKDTLPSVEQALPGRSTPIPVSAAHFVSGQSLQPPFAAGLEQAVFAMGCFWGAERRFWQQPGVLVTAAGYAGGQTPNPTYDETCSGLTGHTEVVLVVFDPQLTSYAALLKVFWEAHNPTHGLGGPSRIYLCQITHSYEPLAFIQRQPVDLREGLAPQPDDASDMIWPNSSKWNAPSSRD